MRLSLKKCALFSVALTAVLLGWGAIVADAGGGPLARPDGTAVKGAGDANDLRWDLTDGFEFDWESVELSAKTTKEARLDIPVPTITVSMRLDFPDGNTPKGVVTVDLESAEIVEVLDEHGKTVNCSAVNVAENRRYRQSDWFWYEDRSYFHKKLKPFDATVRLTGGTNDPLPSSISRLTGYIYALCADDVIEVQIPFDPNAGCIETEAAPDLRICIDPTTPPRPEPLRQVNIAPADLRVAILRPTTPVPLYKYTTWVKSNTGQPVMGVYDPIFNRLDFPFGDYAVVRTELVDPTKRFFFEPHIQMVVSDALGSRGARCEAEATQVSGDDWDTISHVIAVHPVEVKIPFVLRDIPVPEFPSSEENGGSAPELSVKE